MVTDKKEALEGVKNGELTLAEIAIELRNDEEIAIEAIKQYGSSAITFLNATNSLPHTPEVFLTILDSERTIVSKKIKTNSELALENIEEDIDELMEINADLIGELANIDRALETLNKYKQNIPEKGGQEH